MKLLEFDVTAQMQISVCHAVTLTYIWCKQ